MSRRKSSNQFKSSCAAGPTSYIRKVREKSSVLSSRLKAVRVVDEITFAGRAFQTSATMTGKARSPTVDNRDVGKAKVSENHDRNRCLDGRSLTLCSSVYKYAGARP